MKMAQASLNDLDSYRCSVCLDPLKDPVTIPCGHSYCMCCISGCWDQEEQKAGYSCPQCRETFSPRPALKKSTVLAELVEKLQITDIQSDPLQLSYAGPGDAECDFCIGRKLRAVKSCLVCVASYCETHIQPHYQSATFQKHALTKASTKLHENLCSQHNRLLELFCRTDERCICVLCTVDEHRGHGTVSTATERTEKQEETRKICQQTIEKRDKELHKMKESFLIYKDAAQEAEEHCEQVFTELLQCVETAHAKVKDRIREQQMAAESQAEETLKELEQEIAELKRRGAELERLSQEDDHIHYLQSLQRIPTSNETKDFNPPHLSFELMKKSVSEFKDEVEDVCSKIKEKVSKEVATIFFEVPEFSRLSGKVSSPSLLTWKSYVKPLLGKTKCLSFFLDASSQIHWRSCQAEAILTVINHQNNNNSFSREINHRFCAEHPNQGYPNFMPWKDLMDPEKGFVKDDKVSFMVTVRADEVEHIST
ncbi:E3 ubiquitin/ISG15 ligase TRIM25-like [Clupea harengus]|uniref:E3 ubiquitin/ISG15 ligase TRIM25-like n=1 Tax=Clupea harengus TaxID=7950 RepID=A0A6P8GHF0_CLUHA|nr:E3 ubiquitin/ISG15 ligase TRIM25-like [Clupea harengus]